MGTIIKTVAGDGSALDLSDLVTILTNAFADFLASFWLIVPIAIGVGLAIWGVRRLFSLGKGLAS